MEINSISQEKVGVFTKWWNKLKNFPKKFKKKVGKIAKNTKQIGKDDPRKIWHAFKVGLALTLVSLFYYTEPVFHSFDEPIMWAVLTVVVAFEFTVGATISKSINRGIGTALAGAFGIGAKYLAELIGKKGPDPIVLGVLVFIVGALGTFTRFYPHIKRRYDYGTMIFVLTFILVSVSSYRSENIFQLAHRRISTILIGIFTVMTISMIIRPVWAGEDLHKLVCTNLEKLASFLEGFGSEFFHIFDIENVLGSKTTEESLANLAWWEPPHGAFKFNHPWKQYLKIGSLVRKYACHLLALNSHLNSKSQAPTKFERTEEACKKMIMESSNALKELALSIKTMTQPISSIIHIHNAKNAIDDLKHTLGTSKAFFQHDESCVMDFVHVASIVSLLVSITKCVDEIYVAVEELSSKARFEMKMTRDSCSTEATGASEKPPSLSRSHTLHRGTVNPVAEDEVDGGDFVMIEIDDNVESKERMVVEEVNNNTINTTKREYFAIWIRGSTAMAIVEDMEMTKKIEDFIDLADIQLYNSTHEIFKSAKRVVVLEEVNPVNNNIINISMH